MTAVHSVIDATGRNALAAIPESRVRFDEPLAGHCSLGVGGPADALLYAGTEETLRRALCWAGDRRVAWMVLGRGTNVVPSDLGFRGLAIKLEGAFASVSFEGMRLTAGASTGLATLVEEGMRRDLGGLEFTTGIPGCLGGSLVGNAGTATEFLGDRVERVRLMLADGRTVDLTHDELEFGYRRSRLKQAGGVVTAATFALVPRPRAEVAQAVRGYTERRRDQPLNMPNVGCIFKNPDGTPAGRLIDEAGLKGTRSGGMSVSARHANFMINEGGGTARDVLNLIAEVRARVERATGTRLTPEIAVLDEHGRPATVGGAAGAC